MTMVALLVISFLACGVRAAGQEAQGAQEAKIQPPRRRAIAAPIAALPELPSDADRIAPETLDIVARDQRIEAGQQGLKERITRTVDRIHLSSNGREWLFERNPRDPRRVSGTLIDHAAKALIFHDESDLRNMLGMGGWADALKLGSEPGFAVRRTAVPVDHALLRSPAERFPAYKAFDLAEWLERR